MFLQPAQHTADSEITFIGPQIEEKSQLMTINPVSSSPITKPKIKQAQLHTIDLDASDESSPNHTPPPLLNGTKVEMTNPAVTPIASFPSDRSVLDKTADLSLNWGEHGEQIALSLGSKEGDIYASPSSSASMSQQTILVPSRKPTADVFLRPRVLHGGVGPSTSNIQPTW